MYVYIMTNANNTTLYIGVTNHLGRRILEHKACNKDCFTAWYGLNKLVYYEYTDSKTDAINREKQLKKFYKKSKIRMITNFNPQWQDLTEKILG